jgi:L-iditol 2-dehydrogenase
VLSYQYYAPKDIRLEEVAELRLADDEVLVQIEAALTGGTDVKTYLRGHPTLIKSIPSSFGYEFAGKIIKSQSKDFGLGMRVIAANTAPCYECFFCKKQEFELCENLEYLNGSFAEQIIIPANIVKHNLYELPSDLDYKSAAMTQTLAVALHGLDKSQIKAGDNIIILGLGAVGQCFIKLCKSYLSNVTVFALGRSPLKLNLAKANQADYVIDVNDFDMAVEELKRLLPYGADVVIEAVGQIDTWQEALKLVRKGGLVNFFGGCKQGSTIELDTYQAHYQELRTIGTYHHQPKYIKEALRLIATNTINVSNLISSTRPLAELSQALESMIAGKDLKVCIEP